MKTTVHCPECGRTLAVSEDLQGKEVRCPACRTVFTANDTAAAAPLREPAEEALTPTARRRRRFTDEEEIPSRPQKQTSYLPIVLAIVIPVILVTLLVCGGVIIGVAMFLDDLESDADILIDPEEAIVEQPAEMGGPPEIGVPGENPPPRIPHPAELRTLRTATDDVWHVRFSPDNRTVATLGKLGVCQVWDRETGDERGSFRLDAPQQFNWLTFSSDGKHLVAWDGAGMLYLREGATGRVVTRIDPGGWDAGYNRGAFFPDGKALVVVRGGFIKFWSVPDGDRLRQYEDVKATAATHFSSCNVSADGKWLITGAHAGGAGGLERYDQVWDLTGNKPPRRLKGFDRTNDSARHTMSPDGKLLLLNTSRRIELLDWETDKIALTLDAPADGEFRRITFTPDGKRLITSHTDGALRMWDVATGNNLATFQTGIDLHPIGEVAVSQDGKMLATSSGAAVTLWKFAEVFPPK